MLAWEAFNEIEELISERGGAHRRDLLHRLIESRCYAWAVDTHCTTQVIGRDVWSVLLL